MTRAGPLWRGAHATPFDPRPLLQKLTGATFDDALGALYDGLFRQGRVGLASYAAVPTLVEHRCLELVASIELARRQPENPELPEWMRDGYVAALEQALIMLPDNDDDLIGLYVLHALRHGSEQLALSIYLLDPDEAFERFEDQPLGADH